MNNIPKEMIHSCNEKCNAIDGHFPKPSAVHPTPPLNCCPKCRAFNMSGLMKDIGQSTEEAEPYVCLDVSCECHTAEPKCCPSCLIFNDSDKDRKHPECMNRDCPCHLPATEPNYNHISHTHCWKQKQSSACGIPMEKHTQCCLCDLKVPTTEPKCSECQFEEDHSLACSKRVEPFSSVVEPKCEKCYCACHENKLKKPYKEWEKDYLDKFSHRFTEIAQMADAGNDRGYGKGLARLENDIESFITTLLHDERARTLALINAIRPHDDETIRGSELNEALSSLRDKLTNNI